MFHAISSIYYRDANGALIVFDITDKKSFHKLKQWVDEIIRERPDIPIILAANKSDLEKRRDISTEDAERFINQLCKRSRLSFI